MTTQNALPGVNACAECGRLLTDDDYVLCGPCTERARDNWYDPSDEGIEWGPAVWQHMDHDASL